MLKKKKKTSKGRPIYPLSELKKQKLTSVAKA